jgi:hypothetical protein
MKGAPPPDTSHRVTKRAPHIRRSGTSPSRRASRGWSRVGTRLPCSDTRSVTPCLRLISPVDKALFGKATARGPTPPSMRGPRRPRRSGARAMARFIREVSGLLRHNAESITQCDRFFMSAIVSPAGRIFRSPVRSQAQPGLSRRILDGAAGGPMRAPPPPEWDHPHRQRKPDSSGDFAARRKSRRSGSICCNCLDWRQRLCLSYRSNWPSA